MSSLRSISTSADSSDWKTEGGGDARPNNPDDLGMDANLFASMAWSGKGLFVGPGLPYGEPLANPESETDEMRRCALIRTAFDPVSGANDARLDDCGPARDARVALERSNPDGTWLCLRLSDWRRMSPRLGAECQLTAEQGHKTGANIPALLDFCPQHGDGIFVVPCFAICSVDLILQSGTLVRHVGQGVGEVVLPGLDLRKGVGEFVSMASDFCKGRPEVGDDVCKDFRVKRLWPLRVCRGGRGERLIVELTLELDGEVDGVGSFLRAVGAVVGGGHGWVLKSVLGSTGRVTVWQRRVCRNQSPYLVYYHLPFRVIPPSHVTRPHCLVYHQLRALTLLF